MKLLILSTVWPEPSSTAAGSRMLQLIAAFQEKEWEVSYASTAGDSEHSIDFKKYGIQKHSIAVNDSGFDTFVSDLDPEIVMFDRFMSEEQFGWRVAKACPNAVRILDTEDLHCLRHGRHLAVKEGRDFQEEDLFNEIALREIASIHRSDLTLMISDYEMALLQRIFKVDERKLLYIPFMIDEIDSVWKGWEEREHFVTIGNFMHAPNLDSVKYLKEKVWPEIHAKLPESELHVYGSYVSEKEMLLSDPANGFIVKGRAEGAIETISEYRVLLVPLRFGAGLKGKFFDAMQSGTPSVTTPIGLEGISSRAEFPGVIGDDSKHLIEAAINLYSGKENWNNAQSKIQPVLKGRFSADQFKLKLMLSIEELRATIHSRRSEDFMGQLLNHHTLRSTEFMSRWIEEKNRPRS